MTSWSYALSRILIFIPLFATISLYLSLLDDLYDAAGAHGAPACANGKAKACVHRDRLNELDGHLGVVSRHDHLAPAGQLHGAGHVGGPEVELGPVIVEERRVPPTLVLGQDVHLRLELGVRSYGAGLGKNLAALDIVLLGTAQQDPCIVARLSLIQHLAEHLDARHHGFRGLLLDSDDLDLFSEPQNALLDPAGDNGPPSGDGEDILDRHEERLGGVALGLMEAVDQYVPEPERDTAKPFLMPIEDVLTLTGRGIVVMGRVVEGVLLLGEEIEIVGIEK